MNIILKNYKHHWNFIYTTLKILNFKDENGNEKILKFNYDYPHSFIQIDENDNSSCNVIGQPLYLSETRVYDSDTNIIQTHGPFWELYKPCEKVNMNI